MNHQEKQFIQDFLILLDKYRVKANSYEQYDSEECYSGDSFVIQGTNFYLTADDLVSGDK